METAQLTVTKSPSVSEEIRQALANFFEPIFKQLDLPAGTYELRIITNVRISNGGNVALASETPGQLFALRLKLPAGDGKIWQCNFKLPLEADQAAVLEQLRRINHDGTIKGSSGNGNGSQAAPLQPTDDLSTVLGLPAGSMNSKEPITVTITPEMAFYLLAEHPHASHSVVAFNCRGKLVAGHEVLHEISDTETAMPVTVILNVDASPLPQPTIAWVGAVLKQHLGDFSEIARQSMRVALVSAERAVERPTLERFAQVLGTGKSAGDSESAAIALRTDLLNTRDVESPDRQRLRCKVAIAAFVQGRKLERIEVTDTTVDPYPLA